MKKYIHYCWFGKKPLSKLAKKCIKSWEKYLPDYEIIRWDETNCDLDECAFVKGAYESKKWAFVADYFRTKALYDYGGIYFDTDMEVTKDISKLLKDNSFLGVEDTGFVAVGVWYEKNKNSELAKCLLNSYKKIDSFKVEEMNKKSIPKMITEILKKWKYEVDEHRVMIYRNGLKIYPREYFYPLSMNRDTCEYTDNTCMVHYYDATWLTKKQKIEMYLVRNIGRDKTVSLENFYHKNKIRAKKIVKIILFPIVLYRRKKAKEALITDEYINRNNNTVDFINKNSGKEYITVYNNKWLGITSATVELFDNLVDCGELFRKKDVKLIGDAILDAEVNQVIFSAFALGWAQLVKYLKNKNPELKIKTFWHGSHSQVLDSYGWQRNMEIIKLHKKNYINVMGTCKKSLVDFYYQQGYNVKFLTNKVNINLKKAKRNVNKDEVRIGLYAAKCNDWRKNMYTQIAAVSLIENATIDMVPLNKEAEAFAKLLGVKITGVSESISRNELIKRMGQQDVVLYVTFSECAPMLPLECMHMGVPCLTGNNHHYFKNSSLENYVVVFNESDPVEIKNKISDCMKNKDKIIKLFNDFSCANDSESRREISEFLDM